MDLIYLFKSLLRRKWLIIGSTILAVVLAFLLTMNEKKLYRSYAQMATGFTTASSQVKLQDAGFNIYEIDVKFNNVVESFRSPKVIGMISYQLMIHDLENPKPYRTLSSEDKETERGLKIDRNKMLAALHDHYNKEKLLSSFDNEERKYLELIKLYKYDLENIRKLLYVDRVQRTDFVNIEFNSGNPELSAFVVNQICQEFLRNHESSRSQQNVQSISTLKTLVDQKRAELDSNLAILRVRGGVDVSVESTSKLTQVSTFETRLADERNLLNMARNSLDEIEGRLREMERTNTTTTTGSSSSANLEYVRVKAQRDQVLAEYVNKGSNDPELYARYQKLAKEAQVKLNAINSNSGGAIGSPGVETKASLLQKKSDLEVQIKSAEQNIASYNSRIGSLNSSVNFAAQRNADNLAMQKQVELAQAEYENVKSRYDAALNNKVAPMDDFRQTLFGQPAVEPEPSKRVIILGFAGMTMFVFCCIAIIFMEYVDVSIKTPSQYLRTMDLKMIGVISRLGGKKPSVAEAFEAEADKKKKTGAEFREQLRKIRYVIEQSGHKIYLVTSARKGEGKTTVIKALAKSLSLSHKKVLLIDANFPNNTLTQSFEAQPTLEDFTAQDNNVSFQKMSASVSQTDIPNVDIIGCKGGDYTPTEVLGENNLLRYAQLLSTGYDYIFIEGPALNGRADSRELVRYADSVISVVSARSSVKQTDKESLAFLKDLKEKYTGAVLNNVEPGNIDL
ncbi:Wzz/FepE/Etk N-terminal domain-containing protein [Chitinophaga horti]|uniref:Wzz/FepE/Etk N-terminal domain-containing protein n=1 Tax=Chitinophaga horti TaxID=2920382 RepID=A0ABY6J6C7_9BACT|nr:AAA family ATPase [Chitinophaga horti]UYQ95239.1 Wzz/FepE/Etk N-terminal domain-containing protein [Chitinophaga horti]